jgi:hypothetical protein
MKKLKDGYFKFTHFKVWILFFKSDERSGIISEIFLNQINNNKLKQYAATNEIIYILKEEKISLLRKLSKTYLC